VSRGRVKGREGKEREGIPTCLWTLSGSATPSWRSRQSVSADHRSCLQILNQRKKCCGCRKSSPWHAKRECPGMHLENGFRGSKLGSGCGRRRGCQHASLPTTAKCSSLGVIFRRVSVLWDSHFFRCSGFVVVLQMWRRCPCPSWRRRRAQATPVRYMLRFVVVSCTLVFCDRLPSL
jgi:hypothetical protein